MRENYEVKVLIPPSVIVNGGCHVCNAMTTDVVQGRRIPKGDVLAPSK